MSKTGTSQRSTTRSLAPAVGALAALTLLTAPPASAATPAQTWAYDSAHATLFNQATNGCLAATTPGAVTIILDMRQCTNPSTTVQRFQVQPQAIVSQNPATQGFCLTGSGPNGPTGLIPCNGGTAQRYALDPSTRTIRNLTSGLCLTANAVGQATTMRTCV
ncbi:ricin-type beta-trefoil lectin domain protein [Actinomadura terrae]|uniref:ricin-type beta-trefoil lectin domain protein n=1 Tax=Actinomadura terrae TaxID=604353 RepID=UPI001FA74D41|nr:ricin-type beta-trefoil lectin domain protein [Actinomadura terrae]